MASDASPRTSGYEIPDITFRDPNNRRVKILTIGAGISGIWMTYLLQKHCQNIEHVVYEKNEDIGGTWLENRYPGAACDVPSHAYTFNFALNPDWPRHTSKSSDISAYLDKVCKVFDLRKYMTFHTTVIGCSWNEEAGQWTVKLRQSKPGSAPREFEETCDLLLQATGLLNNFKWPEIEGLGSFKGKVIHTAQWPEDYQKEQWKDDSVAIIGSGSSSIQTLPNMQPYVKHIDVFVRTAVWFIAVAGSDGNETFYTEDERSQFRNDPKALIKHAKAIESQMNGLWEMFLANSETQKEARQKFEARMAETIKDPRLLEGFRPNFAVGCRRIALGDPYQKAIQEPNVDVHFSTVTKITENSVIDNKGSERRVDTIICATGFDVSYCPRFPIVGKNGVELAAKWKHTPEAYLGLAVPDIPNFITFVGPSWPIANGSIMGPLGKVGEYVVKIINKMQTELIHSFVPKQDITDAFNEHAQELLKDTVWVGNCKSWYKNNETGRVNSVYPGSALHYLQLIKEPRWEDFHIKYQNKFNPWAFLGRGYTVEDRAEGADKAPYLNEEVLDPKWLEAVTTNGALVGDEQTQKGSSEAL